MTTQTLFTQAHATARRTVHIVGDYRLAFTFALRELYRKARHSAVSNWLARAITWLLSLAIVRNYYVEVPHYNREPQALEWLAHISRGRRYTAHSADTDTLILVTRDRGLAEEVQQWLKQ